MNTFIAYRSTGESPEDVEALLGTIKQTFAERGVAVYATHFDPAVNATLSALEIVQHAFKVLDTVDFLFVVQSSSQKSEGMLIEVGYCLAKAIPIIVATKDDVTKTYLPELGEQVLRWHDLKDLSVQIGQLELVS